MRESPRPFRSSERSPRRPSALRSSSRSRLPLLADGRSRHGETVVASSPLFGSRGARDRHEPSLLRSRGGAPAWLAGTVRGRLRRKVAPPGFSLGRDAPARILHLARPIAGSSFSGLLAAFGWPSFRRSADRCRRARGRSSASGRARWWLAEEAVAAAELRRPMPQPALP